MTVSPPRTRVLPYSRAVRRFAALHHDVFVVTRPLSSRKRRKIIKKKNIGANLTVHDAASNTRDFQTCSVWTSENHESKKKKTRRPPFAHPRRSARPRFLRPEVGFRPSTTAVPTYPPYNTPRRVGARVERFAPECFPGYGRRVRHASFTLRIARYPKPRPRLFAR